MDTQHVLALLEEALELDAGQLTAETEIAGVETWDSLGWLGVMSVLDERLDIRLDTQKIPTFVTVQDLLTHIEQRLGQRA